MHVTLNAIRAHAPCREGLEKLLAHLGKDAPDDEPLSLMVILENNGIDYALWCLKALPEEYDAAVRLLVCDFAEPALQYTDDPRPRQAIETARRFACGEATKDELKAAKDDALRAGGDDFQASDFAAVAAGSAADWGFLFDAELIAYFATQAAVSASAVPVDEWESIKAPIQTEQEQIFRAWLEVHARAEDPA